jgi:hypothetical protein
MTCTLLQWTREVTSRGYRTVTRKSWMPAAFRDPERIVVSGKTDGTLGAQLLLDGAWCIRYPTLMILA